MHLHQRVLLYVSSQVLVVAAFSCVNSSVIQWVDCAQNVPTYFNAANANISIDITNLPSTLHCGKIVVPMDYQKQISAQNNITLSLAMHRPVNPTGVIFYNGGGGDPNAVVAWEVALGMMNAFSGLLDYDLMMMDTRGTYESNTLNISDVGLQAVREILQSLPSNQSAFDAVKEASAVFIKDVAQYSNPHGIIQYVSASEVVQDYEQIRIALGYDKINFLGLSYGTYRATQYAATYPERVENFVLDAVTPHNLKPYYAAQSQIAALNRVMLRADAYCQNNVSCAFHSKGKGSIPAAYKELLASAPLFIPGSDEKITAFEIQGIVADEFESEGVDFPSFFEQLNISLSGDGSVFVGGSPGISAVGTIILECGDNDYQHTDFTEWEKSLNTGLAHDPNQVAQPSAWQLQLGCLSWPFEPPSNKPFTTKVPMLLVTSDFDGALPTEWAEIGLAQSKDSVLVVRHGDDHTSFSLTDQPSWVITVKFLRTGIMPDIMSNSQVTVLAEGTRRGKIPDPYSVPTGEVAGDVNSGNLTSAGILP